MDWKRYRNRAKKRHHRKWLMKQQRKHLLNVASPSAMRKMVLNSRGIQ